MNNIRLKSMLEEFYKEDIGDGDLSSESIFTEGEKGTFHLIAKEAGIFCGRKIIELAFPLLGDEAEVEVYAEDGDSVKEGELIAKVTGGMRTLLQGERVVLNLIQRMSGIATTVNRAVRKVEGSGVRICDTRKTTPGLRMLEKYAVRTGGGYNHRFGLYDAVMLKDNHISFAGSITSAVKKARKQCGHTVKIEVEIESENGLIEAVESGADIIMFDNCTPQEIKGWIHHVPSHIITEASGGITEDNVREYAQSGVHYISLGYLTHSIKSLDISARVLAEEGDL
ncbi:carboxylating nicotinate-nucleotide diphosphorylase [Rossellomorea aquimaris]|uniref:carboxylating nicotinate-nucleotide diphosphorylase n=1 Tax=Rossellomorea aquimaris TaxID=189382 RepID=UPI001CD438A3|nr:carboxylating nicotinate-nucleotide diphosphorylase [Rossellomorea aquimaris]MCA1056296.1 carboxylating nicotinate-nucleotide diphosphorylase [Rossellomorea aquimaris]